MNVHAASGFVTLFIYCAVYSLEVLGVIDMFGLEVCILYSILRDFFFFSSECDELLVFLFSILSQRSSLIIRHIVNIICSW